jgi:hypothetical protein
MFSLFRVNLPSREVVGVNDCTLFLRERIPSNSRMLIFREVMSSKALIIDRRDLSLLPSPACREVLDISACD